MFLLLQTSFLIYILPAGLIPNLIVGFVALFAVFEKKDRNTKYAAAIVGGLLLDMFSQNIFGFWTVLLITLVLLLQVIIGNYVRTPFLQRA